MVAVFRIMPYDLPTAFRLPRGEFHATSFSCC
jgi:hypothetical protein